MCEYSSGYSTYKYGYNGLRTSKTILGPNNRITNVKYIYEGDKLLQMTYDNYVLTFSYDANGVPVSFHVTNGYDIDTDYYYGVNSRGDVIALYNANGSLYTTYQYDAYGKLMGGAPSSAYDIANLNPLRYRSYVYDNETGLYYLQSRYYDPVTCRFINADCLLSDSSLLALNSYAYCLNNPIVYYDPYGTDAIILVDYNSYSHIGAMIEDEEGFWFHTYWGAPGNIKISSSSSTGGDGASYSIYSGNEINAFSSSLLHDINNSNGPYSGYDDYIYLTGDYSSCIYELIVPVKSYDLLFNNCSEFTIGTLAKVNNEYSEELTYAKDIVIPACAFDYLKGKIRKPVYKQWDKILTTKEKRLSE